jgi:hypothetical protein
MNLICSDNALRALHRILVCTRFQAYENIDVKTIGDVMDAAEYLVSILQNHEGLTEEEGLERFRLYLGDLETRFPGYTDLIVAFDMTPQQKQLVTIDTRK